MTRRYAIPFIALAFVLAACGSSSKSSTTSPATTPAAGSPTTAAPPVTVSSASVPGVGTVLVNGKGWTLYILTTEKGGTITCTDANGCTKVWPDNELPAGVTSAIAGAGIQPSLLGTATNSNGDHYVSYGGYPLYTFTGDSGPGQAHGQGIKSFGGTWWVMSPAGTPVTTIGTTATTKASGGYGY